MSSTLRIIHADLDDPRHAAAIVELIDLYAGSPSGGGRPLSEVVRREMIPGLKQHPSARVILAFEGETAAGVAVCFIGYSTFAARPLVNIHDLAVRPGMRGRGIGSQLLEAVETLARDHDCCKVTLEVRDDNPARRLYERFGFDGGTPGSSAHGFWTKRLDGARRETETLGKFRYGLQVPRTSPTSFRGAPMSTTCSRPTYGFESSSSKPGLAATNVQV